MRGRGIVMLAFALLLGVVSAFLIRQWLANQTPATAETLAVKPVVVARIALNFGDRVTTSSLKVVDWPAATVPDGTFSKIAELTGEGEDRVVLRAMEAGEPVLSSKVSGQHGRAALSMIIDKDMRAVTIQVNEVYGVAGFVLPNDHVDVLLTRKQDQKNPTNDVLLQNVKVLGVDQDASEQREKPAVARAVTLEVTTEQAQKLTLGSQVGTLSLALRNQANAEAERARTIDVSDLRVGEANVAEKPTAIPKLPAPDPLAKIEVLRGTKSETHEVIREGSAPHPGRARPAAQAKAGPEA